MARFRTFRRRRPYRTRRSYRSRYGRYRRRGTRIAYVKGEKKAYRKCRKLSGMINKVGIYFPELGAKVFVSRKKFNVMYNYAKLIVHRIINKHAHHEHEHPIGPLNRIHELEMYRIRKGMVKRAQYRRMINHVLVQMVKKNWYSLWYSFKNDQLAEQAQQLLHHAHHHHAIHETAGVNPLTGPGRHAHFDMNEDMLGELNDF